MLFAKPTNRVQFFVVIQLLLSLALILSWITRLLTVFLAPRKMSLMYLMIQLFNQQENSNKFFGFFSTEVAAVVAGALVVTGKDSNN